MGLFSWLFKDKKERPVIRIRGAGEYALDIVGESHYQTQLDMIVGGKCEDGHEVETEALLILDNKNRYDNQAVAVFISGKQVGHLSRENARQFRKRLHELGTSDADAVVGAKIVGGWLREDDEGHYGVKLDMPVT